MIVREYKVNILVMYIIRYIKIKIKEFNLFYAVKPVSFVWLNYSGIQKRTNAAIYD